MRFNKGTTLYSYLRYTEDSYTSNVHIKVYLYGAQRAAGISIRRSAQVTPHLQRVAERFSQAHGGSVYQPAALIYHPWEFLFPERTGS